MIELYKTLCRAYKDCGDDIYLFGFSRGAFTVRMLAGMIDHCGLYTSYCNEDDLRKAARGNFQHYHSKYNRGWLTWPFRRPSRRCPEICGNERPEIEFIGVWDTVDAYGLPVDWLATAWDLLIYPLRFVNKCLGDQVKRTCHALSIDDERQTFHPLLWTEHENAENIKQVWFAGVHSDVGGGYPRYELALVTLDWMMSEVEEKCGRKGLHFIPEVRKEYLIHSDWHGVQHDSRSGVAAYYRYLPRDIQQLCKAACVKRPKIHRGVFERIKQDIVPYAPTALPTQYEVVETGCQEHDAETSNDRTGMKYESRCQSQERAKAMRGVRAIITKRRCLYFAFVAVSVILALFVVATLFAEPTQDSLSVSDRWILVLRQSPWWSASAVSTAIGVLLYLKVRWFRATQTIATRVWAHLKTRRPAPTAD